MQIGLKDAKVREIEYGVVLRPGPNVQQILRNHRNIPRCRTNTYQDSKGGVIGMEFKGSGFRLKMYDPWRNYGNCPRKIMPHVRPKLSEEGRHKGDNSLKFEFHYTKPEKLNEGKPLTVDDILTPSFDRKCRETLLEHYRSIEKGQAVRFPDNKKDADTATIIFLALMLSCENYKEAINHVLLSLSPGILTPADKYYRKCSINDRIEKLQLLDEPESIESLLKRELELE